MTGTQPNGLGRVFNEVPELYDRVRPTYPTELFRDLVAITKLNKQASVLEIGCGTGQATTSLAALGKTVTAVEPGPDLAALARQRLLAFDNVEVETSSFEEWDDRGRHFDFLVAASSWHWVNPSIGWRRAHEVLNLGGWMALLGHVVVRRPGEPEVYAELRQALLRHIAMEEKILLPYAKAKRGGEPLPIAGFSRARAPAPHLIRDSLAESYFPTRW